MTEVKAQSSRMEYLFQASHAVFAQCPELSRFYMSEFQQCMRQQDLTPAKSITRTSCPRCGQIYVPGFNASVTLKTKRSKSKRNQLIYQCNACTHKMMFQGSSADIPKADLKAAMTTLSSSPVATLSPQSPSPIDKKKKKNKNTKKNQLQAMLANRQQRAKEVKGVGLNDFLSSL